MMKQALTAVALAVAALGASAHPLPQAHQHVGDTVVMGTQVAPKVVTTYETNDDGQRIRVVTTTTCTDTRLSSQNHVICTDTTTRVQRFIDQRPPAKVADVVTRKIERDRYGRRWIVTTTKTCQEAKYDDNGKAVCTDWDTDTDRELVRRRRWSRSMDLDGDGVTNGWERLLYQTFRHTLDN